jgi:hypothetical protein
VFTQFLQPSEKAIHRLYRDFSIVEAPSIQESEMELIYIGYAAVRSDFLRTDRWLSPPER